MNLSSGYGNIPSLIFCGASMLREAMLFSLSTSGTLQSAVSYSLVLTPVSYRLTPTFGRGTIRRFSNNASSMKKLAARDFEDFLQVTVPRFICYFFV